MDGEEIMQCGGNLNDMPTLCHACALFNQKNQKIYMSLWEKSGNASKLFPYPTHKIEAYYSNVGIVIVCMFEELSELRSCKFRSYQNLDQILLDHSRSPFLSNIIFFTVTSQMPL